MILAELMQKIAQKNPPHYNIWFGEEQLIIDTYIRKLSENLVPVYMDTVAGVMSKLKLKSLNKSPKMYIVTEDIEYMKAEQAWKFVQESFNGCKDILILRYSSVNKKLKFYTQQKDSFTEFNHLQPDILTMYIQKEIALSDENCKTLCEMCGNDYGRILLEVDKINQFMEGKRKDIFPNDAFRMLCEDGSIYSEIGDITFELTDAILGGYADVAIKKLQEAKLKGEPELRIIAILYDGFRNLFAYKCMGKDKHDAVKRAGLTGWQVKKCIDLDGGYSLKEIERNMLLCQQIETWIKLGKIDSDIALEFLTLHCLK